MKLWSGLILTAVIFLGRAGSVQAVQADVYKRSVETTPYDHKDALTEVMNASYRPAESPPLESMGGLFRKARHFSYLKEVLRDDWQTPQDTETKRTGDCEDKALWLYARMRNAGYKDVKLVVGKYRRLDSGYHVWLTYTENNGNVLILDPTIQQKAWPLNAFRSDLYRPSFLFDGQYRYSCIPNPRFYS